MSDVQRCNSVRTSGHWRGWRCGAVPKWRTEDGMTWCKNHVPVNAPVEPIEKPTAALLAERNRRESKE